jgi:hypothetical protein
VRHRVVATVEAHLGSQDMARVLYGAVVGLALVLALQDHPPGPGAAAGLVIATALALGLAELYAEAVSVEARTRRPIGRRQFREMLGESIAVIVGAGFPAVFFLLEALDVIGAHAAYVLSKWTGLALICGYGYLASRMAGIPHLRSIARAGVVALVGLAIIGIKSALH